MKPLLDFLMKPMTIIAIGAFITIAGGVITAIGTYLHNKSSSEKSSRIEAGVNVLKEQNSQLVEKTNNQATVIDNLRVENTDLHTKLIEASQIIFKNIKGGEDMIYVQQKLRNQNNYELAIINNNEYPVYGLSLQITDYDQLLNCKYRKEGDEFIFDLPCFVNCTYTPSTSELGTGEIYLTYLDSKLSELLKGDQGRYQIRFKLRNKTYYQQYYFRKIGHIIHAASRVFEVHTDKEGKYHSELIKTFDFGLKEVDFEAAFPRGITNKLTPL